MKSASSSSPSLLRLLNALYSPVWLWEGGSYLATGILIGIRAESATVTVQTANGDLYDHVPVRTFANRDRPGVKWSWVDPAPPTNPETFSPTHPPKGKAS